MESSPKFGRTGSGRMSSIPVPVSDIPLHPNPNRGMARNQSSLNSYGQENEGFGGRSSMLSRNSSQALDRGSSRFDSSLNGYGDEDDGQDDSPEKGNDGGKPVTMSLMALLAETDEDGLDGSKYMIDDDDDFDEEEEEIVEKEKFSNCSVCMVRHNGDAFTACGHTFCRLCSRELSVERGNCPLCNNFILEILDVF